MSKTDTVYMRDYYRRQSPEARARRLERQRAYHSSNRLKNKEKSMVKQYGLTMAAFEAMLAGQGGKCAICETSDWGHYEVPAIDHDHRTGRVRGLLCPRCNAALGLMGDNVTAISRMVSYLGSV